MRKLTRRGVLAAGTLVGTGAVLGAARPEPECIALTHATVIDATGAPPRPDVTVLVRGDQIIGLGRHLPIPRGAQVVDLDGRFVIPGLADMHVHSLYPEGILPQLYIATGVTTVRDMMGLPWLPEWRDRAESGELFGPRWVIGSRILDGRPSIWAGNEAGLFTEVGDEREARAAVRQATADGADFVKVYSRLNRQSLLAIAAEARRSRIPFAGHASDLVPITEAAWAGQRSFEHLSPALFGSSSSAEAEIRRMLAEIKLVGDGNGHRDWFQAMHPIEWLATTAYDERRAARVFTQLRAARATITPTLQVHHVADRPELLRPDPQRLRYLPPGTWEYWESQLEAIFTAGRTPEQAAQHRVLFQHRLRILKQMRRAGVRIMAGTDAGGVPFGYPGFGLHDELALLVEAGFTPMQALQAATREPGRYLGFAQGTIQLGHRADLVVLDADPLHDIRNTQRIHSVMTRGRYLSASDRRALLAEIEAAAAAAPLTRATGCCG